MERLALNLKKRHFSSENYATLASRTGVGFKKGNLCGFSSGREVGETIWDPLEMRLSHNLSSMYLISLLINHCISTPYQEFLPLHDNCHHVKRMSERTTSKVTVTIILFIMILFMCVGQVKASFFRIRVIFDNVSYNGQLKSSWGFSFIIEGTSKLILNDYSLCSI